jgi:hypothetical protein
MAARAQQGDRIRQIGVLATQAEGDREFRALITAFATQLRDLGWIEGKNVRIDYRWPGGDTTRNVPLAKDLVELKPDVLFGGRRGDRMTEPWVRLRRQGPEPLRHAHGSPAGGRKAVGYRARGVPENACYIPPIQIVREPL